MSLLVDLGGSLAAGLLTSVTATCVLPLYPSFLAYLSNQLEDKQGRSTYAMFGGLVVAGVLSFMLLFGLVFTTLLQQSLTSVIKTVSPIVFTFLGAVGVVLLLDLDLGSYFGHVNTPESENPFVNAFGFGFFFGLVALPCNPAFISAFLARTLLFERPLFSMLNFLFFGVGLGGPLLIFSLVSVKWSREVIGVMTDHRTHINRVAGAVLVAVSVYYLVGVFNLLGPGPAGVVNSVEKTFAGFLGALLPV